MATSTRPPLRPEARPEPVHETRTGKVKAAFRADETEAGAVRHNATLSRIDKDGDEGKISTSFGRE